MIKIQEQRRRNACSYYQTERQQDERDVEVDGRQPATGLGPQLVVVRHHRRATAHAQHNNTRL